MEVANQGKSVGILSAAPSSAGLNLGGSGNPDFLIAADTTNNQLESMVQIHGSTSSNGQGELTLSTQGLDSSGNIARGNINLVADSLQFNSQPYFPKSWVVEESENKDPNVGWVWKKYGDGTAECWYRHYVQFNVTNGWGNGWYNSLNPNDEWANVNFNSLHYPFKFKTTPVLIRSYRSDSSYSDKKAMMVMPYTYGNESVTGSVFFAQLGSSTDIRGRLEHYVFGMWK